MTFQMWMDQLRVAGHLLCPASSAVPVDLRGLRPDGTGFHYRCRGVRVRLALYRPGRAAWQVPLWDDRWCPEESLSLWERRPVDADGAQHRRGARLVFDEEAHPDQFAVVDGADEWGWRSHEAGLLGPADAAALFERLEAEVDGHPCGVRRNPKRRPSAAAEDTATAAETVDPRLAALVPHARDSQPILAPNPVS